MRDWLYIEPSKAPEQLNPLVLAYLGDAIFEMYVRQYLISQPNHRPHHLHRLSTHYVSAKAQAKLLDLWMPLLSEAEQDVVRKGRNAKSGTVPRNTDVLVYRHSTAFEALVGYLYYTAQYERLQYLLRLTIGQAAPEA